MSVWTPGLVGDSWSCGHVWTPGPVGPGLVGGADVQHSVGCGGSRRACESIALCKSHVAQNKINGCKI